MVVLEMHTVDRKNSQRGFSMEFLEVNYEIG